MDLFCFSFNTIVISNNGGNIWHSVISHVDLILLYNEINDNCIYFFPLVDFDNPLYFTRFSSQKGNLKILPYLKVFALLCLKSAIQLDEGVEQIAS